MVRVRGSGIRGQRSEVKGSGNQGSGISGFVRRTSAIIGVPAFARLECDKPVSRACKARMRQPRATPWVAGRTSAAVSPERAKSGCSDDSLIAPFQDLNGPSAAYPGRWPGLSHCFQVDHAPLDRPNNRAGVSLPFSAFRFQLLQLLFAFGFLQTVIRLHPREVSALAAGVSALGWKRAPGRRVSGEGCPAEAAHRRRDQPFRGLRRRFRRRWPRRPRFLHSTPLAAGPQAPGGRDRLRSPWPGPPANRPHWRGKPPNRTNAHTPAAMTSVGVVLEQIS